MQERLERFLEALTGIIPQKSWQPPPPLEKPLICDCSTPKVPIECS